MLNLWICNFLLPKLIKNIRFCLMSLNNCRTLAASTLIKQQLIVISHVDSERLIAIAGAMCNAIPTSRLERMSRIGH